MRFIPTGAPLGRVTVKRHIPATERNNDMCAIRTATASATAATGLLLAGAAGCLDGRGDHLLVRDEAVDVSRCSHLSNFVQLL